MKSVLKGKSLILLVVITVFLAACSSNNAGNNAPATEGDTPKETKIKIGVSYQNLQNEFILNLQDAVKARAAEAGITLIEADGQGEAAKQISQIENFITQKVDAIILNPFDRDGSAPAVDKAVAANIPIIILNASVSNMEKASAYVGSEDKASGVIEMQYIADLLDGKGNVVIIHGPNGHSAEIGRTEGNMEVLAKYPDMKVLFEQTANWDRTQALTLMENWLQSGQKIDAVVAQNDEMALGAYKAIEAAKKEKEILVIGIDAIADALKSVEEGKLVGTVFQDARGQGAGALDVAIQAAKGEAYEKVTYIPYQLITKDNLAEFQK